MDSVLKDLRSNVDRIKMGGGPKLMELHRSRKKMPVRERIDTLLDAGYRSCFCA